MSPKPKRPANRDKRPKRLPPPGVGNGCGDGLPPGVVAPGVVLPLTITVRAWTIMSPTPLEPPAPGIVEDGAFVKFFK